MGTESHRKSARGYSENSTSKNRLFVGIDPGASGAMAVIENDLDILVLEDYPGDESQLADLFMKKILPLRDTHPILVAIEKVSAMPKQGVVSMFKFGTNYGIWKGMLAAFRLPFVEVAPRTWQKGIIAKAQDKKPSVAAAGRLFPNAPLFGPKGGAKDGRADALLIAYYCLRQYTKKDM